MAAGPWWIARRSSARDCAWSTRSPLCGCVAGTRPAPAP